MDELNERHKSNEMKKLKCAGTITGAEEGNWMRSGKWRERTVVKSINNTKAINRYNNFFFTCKLITSKSSHLLTLPYLLTYFTLFTYLLYLICLLTYFQPISTHHFSQFSSVDESGKIARKKKSQTIKSTHSKK